MNTVPRREVAGVHLLCYPDGPYVEVAERIRLLHALGKEFRVQQAQTLLVRNRWIYRVTIFVDDQQYIGDAEIHFGASKQTPDGTNPVTCGQTSAIGNALSFAGWGDPRLLLTWQDLRADEVLEMYPTDPPYGQIEGIRVVWLEETPYVPVAERLYHLHTLGHTLTMERCEVVRVCGVWVYRVAITVDECSYIGDAEIHFAAPLHTPERRFPVSTAQTSAVGNALALAGYGDLRTLLARLGKDAVSIPGLPSLASADAVSQAMRQRGLPRDEGGTANAEAQSPPPAEADVTAPMTEQQRETIGTLSAQLGDPLPAEMADWTVQEAEEYIGVLRVLIEDVMEAADVALADLPTNGRASTTGESASQDHGFVSREAVGDLKRAWMQAFGMKGDPAVIRQRWQTFTQETCQQVIDDEAMLSTQYHSLKTAVQAQLYKRATQRVASNGRAARS